MQRSNLRFLLSQMTRSTRRVALVVAALCAVRYGAAQDTPLLSGGVGFFSSTNAGQTSYQPLFEPLLAAPIGPHFLVESRAILLESFSPVGGSKPGYDHSHFISLTYLQGDYFLSPHV